MLEIPRVKQRHDHECGVAVLRAVCQWWGTSVPRIEADPLHGLPPDLLEPTFRRAGLSAMSGEASIPALHRLTGIGWPVCCLVQSGGVGHWVVVRGVRRGRVYAMDPADGEYRSWPGADWLAIWQDSDRRNTPYRGYGLAVWL